MTADEHSSSGRWSDFAVLDDASVDRLLLERDPAAAPTGYVDVATVLAAASAPPGPGELAGEALTLASYRQEMLMGQRSMPWRRAMSRLGRPRVAAAAIAAGLAFNAGLSAAATDSLPAPAQRIVSQVLGLAGITVPDGRAHPRRLAPADSPSGNGSAPAPAGSYGNPAPPPGALDAARNGPTGAASRGTTQPRPVAASSQQSTGVVRGGSGPIVGWQGHGPASSTQPAAAPGRSGGYGNGNAWGHVSQSSGPPGQSGTNGNGNGWGHVNRTAGFATQSGTNGNDNGNGNGLGHAKNAAISSGQGGSEGNGNNGNGHGQPH